MHSLAGISGGLFPVDLVLVLGVVVLLGLAPLVLLILVIVDIVRRPDWQWELAGQEKVLWILLVALVNVLAIPSLIYWFVIRPKLVAVGEHAARGAYGPGYVGPSGWRPGPPPGVPAASPPGWYPNPNPARQGTLRYWSGVSWGPEAPTPHGSGGQPPGSGTPASGAASAPATAHQSASVSEQAGAGQQEHEEAPSFPPEGETPPQSER